MSTDFEYEDPDGYFVDKKYNDDALSIRSTSEYLKNSYWGDFYEDTARETEEGLYEVLKSLNNTINLTLNSSDGNEDTLVVKYSDGKSVNNLISKEFYVSPSVLLNEDLNIIDKDETYYSKLDALHGQVLLCSFIKKNVVPSSAIEYGANKNWAIRNIFMTDLYALANNEVYRSWPGFKSYITQQQRVFFQNKKTIIENIKKAEESKIVSFDDIIETLCYNRLSLDKIDYSVFEKSLRKVIEKADVLFNDWMNESFSKEDMFKKAKTIYKKLEKLIDPYEFEKDEIAYSFSMLASSQERGFTGDNSYNNHVFVEGDIISETIDHKQKIRQSTKLLEDKLTNTVLTKEEHLLERKYVLSVPAVNPETISEYKKVVDKLKKNIRDIKSVFQFKNNTPSSFCYGLQDGYLDDNSLQKMYLNDYDKMYQRKETFESREYHVTIAIDQSSSMRGRMKEASRLAIVMAEALEGIKNVYFSVYGFATPNLIINTVAYCDKNYKKIEAMAEPQVNGSTALGFHIAAIADKITGQYSSIKKRIMFVITDGIPTHGSLCLDAINHTANSVRITRSLGIDVFGIGVMNAFTDAVGKKIFGANQFAIISDVQSTLPLLVRKLKKYLQRIS